MLGPKNVCNNTAHNTMYLSDLPKLNCFTVGGRSVMYFPRMVLSSGLRVPF